jgi:hypothetical protein
MRYGWSSDKLIWAKLAQALPVEMNWRFVQLRSNNASAVSDQPGVYLICGAPPVQGPIEQMDFYNSLYVGQASILRKRFLDHCLDPVDNISSLKACWGTSLDFFSAILPPESLDKIEALLIESLGPPGNKQRGNRIMAHIGRPQPA